jgi:hypothetical protein
MAETHIRAKYVTDDPDMPLVGLCAVYVCRHAVLHTHDTDIRQKPHGKRNAEHATAETESHLQPFGDRCLCSSGRSFHCRARKQYRPLEQYSSRIVHHDIVYTNVVVGCGMLSI